ncbi:hypothetical protein GUITHDRAFT_119878 [Guillardia theta CCMP2712]|uniref:Uncharacterized protein n=1 Tax=Guillardia theta (strain CCMP2712) TaxID=905079 RepID=L1ICY8_GUITC|nr:hypothetical protein GUITHDRAFT_119878 [Guillardia theta CCMP2712]EKX33952.1 hypothetical protein GUITHDRAFT_119878 [Guillardia theta CCMP2712]|eukprot:XP_005820932.1 hypothetical protein GUITHDRAFT_119878 [Guillardia theta CCMP2712]
MRSSPLFDPSPRPREQPWAPRERRSRDAASKQEKRQVLPPQQQGAKEARSYHKPSPRSAEYLYRTQAQSVEVGRGVAGGAAGAIVHDVVSQRLEQLFQEFQVDGPLLESLRGALLARETSKHAKDLGDAETISAEVIPPEPPGRPPKFVQIESIKEAQQEEKEPADDDEASAPSPVQTRDSQSAGQPPNGARLVQVAQGQERSTAEGPIDVSPHPPSLKSEPPSSMADDVTGAAEGGRTVEARTERPVMSEKPATREDPPVKDVEIGQRGKAVVSSHAEGSRSVSDGVARMMQAASVWQKRCIDAEEATQRVYPILSKACSRLQLKVEEEEECRRVISLMKAEVKRLRAWQQDSENKLLASQQECRTLSQQVQSLTGRLADREKEVGGVSRSVGQEEDASLRTLEMEEELNMSRELIGELKTQVGELRSRNVELENILERYVHLWNPQASQEEERRRRRRGREEEEEREVDLGDLGSLLSSGLVTKARSNWMATWRGEAEKHKEALEHREKEMNALIAVLEQTTMQVAALEEEKERERELRVKAEHEKESSEIRVREAEQHSRLLAREKGELQEEVKRLQAAVRACQARMYQHSLSLAQNALPLPPGGSRELKAAELPHPSSLSDALPPLSHRSLEGSKEEEAAGSKGIEGDPSSSFSPPPPAAASHNQQLVRQEEELLKLRAKVLEQRTWGLKAWQEIQRLNGMKLNLEQEVEFFKERIVEDERRKENAATSELLRECLWLAVKENKALLLSDFVNLPSSDREEYMSRVTAVLQAASLSSGKDDSLPPNLASASVNDTCIGLMQLLKKEKAKLREARMRNKELEEEVGRLQDETRKLQEIADMRGYVAVQAKEQLRSVLGVDESFGYMQGGRERTPTEDIAAMSVKMRELLHRAKEKDSIIALLKRKLAEETRRKQLSREEEEEEEEEEEFSSSDSENDQGVVGLFFNEDDDGEDRDVEMGEEEEEGKDEGEDEEEEEEFSNAMAGNIVVKSIAVGSPAHVNGSIEVRDILSAIDDEDMTGKVKKGERGGGET